MIHYGPPEHVYVELDWYDGPRAGIADIAGQPHRFESLFDRVQDAYPETYVVWPIDETILALEIEQWQIFVKWNERFEAGEATTKSHPVHGAIDPRWDELGLLLAESRTTIPENAQRAWVQFDGVHRVHRYELSGPAYTARWHML